MSDASQGPGWWIASDGKWYPPELHPAVREAPRATGAAAPAQRTSGHAQRPAHVGPHFPDLFQNALHGAPMADIVSVRYDGSDERSVTTVRSAAGHGDSFSAPSATGSRAKGDSKRWHRKGR